MLSLDFPVNTTADSFIGALWRPICERERMTWRLFYLCSYQREHFVGNHPDLWVPDYGG